jgi:hypothetical protein
VKRKLAARFWDLCAADFLSPKDFVRHAVLVLLIFGVAHLAGLREFTSVLNGTTGAVGMDMETATLLGASYVLVYLAAILLMPILLIAAAFVAVWQKIRARKQPPGHDF